MKPVTTASLNQQPFFFENDAFDRLERYLRQAERVLANNPDREEILRDLEQAIAERCQSRMQPGGRVILRVDLEKVLDDMGPVTDPGIGEMSANAAEPDPESKTHPSPLEQLSQGALLSGVCMGVARHFGVDVSLLRIAVVILTLISAGVMIGLYLLLMFLLPYAPIDPEAAPMNPWPRKIRDFVERTRGKLSATRR